MRGNLAGAGSFRGLKIVGVLLVGLLAGVLLVGVMLAGGRSVGAQEADSSNNPRDLDKGCKAHRVPVDITGTEYEIYGELCLPDGGQTTPKTVQLLLHGITYGTYYWDFPFKSKKYSYVDYANRKGYATFNIDRIGIGRSDHPPSAQVTLDTNAMVASQLMEKLRKGDIDKKKFKFVILVGHSYGSATSWLAQSEHDAGTPGYPAGADALISTGWGHRLQSEPVQRFFSEQIVAETDDKFANDGRTYDPGYFTPSPPPYLLDPYADNEREKDYLYFLGEDIYDPGSATGYEDDNDPSDDNVTQKVLALDSKYKQTVTQEELSTFQNRNFDGTTESIEVPVFLINGTEELFFCGDELVTGKNGNPSTPETEPGYYCGSGKDLTEFEGQFFEEAACFKARIVPDAGHDLNLHKNARTTYQTAERFADMAVGPNGGRIDRYQKKKCAAG
ncbi:MAG: alpha/beta hydrolase [Rubrobacteraceae bacterium]